MTSNITYMQGVKSVKDVELSRKRVLIRVDFNVPMDAHQNISDDRRIKEALQTINYCIDHQARSIILVSHFGRPRGEYDDAFSLRHIRKRLERLLELKVLFVEDFEAERPLIESVENSGVVLLENIRFYTEEERNDAEFSKALGSLCDVYVNDAFGTSHRQHASTYGITEHVPVKVAGFLLKKEIEAFAKALQKPTRPITLVLGGAKISSKITLLHSIIEKIDKLIIGGAMSNTFLKAMGYEMQNSLVEDDYLDIAREIVDEAKKRGVKFYLPVDAVITDAIDRPIDIRVVPTQELLENFSAVDIGPATVKLFHEAIELSNTIIWNGPMGIYEIDKFSRGTFKVAGAIADTYAYSIVGGGDTADAVDRAGEKENFSFISTGGGASLELLEGKILPGFQNLDRV
jgi:phosphoglycerate kinase